MVERETPLAQSISWSLLGVRARAVQGIEDCRARTRAALAQPPVAPKKAIGAD